MQSYDVLVIPVFGPIEKLPVPCSKSLEILQQLVGGFIEAVPILGCDSLTSYVNEDGKYTCIDDNGDIEINLRATQLLAPGLFPGDFIAGNLVICGFDPSKGENTSVPDDVIVQIVNGATR